MRHSVHIACLFLAAVSPLRAQAALGGDERSISRDEAVLQSSHQVKPAAAYIVHELTLPEGILVREYLGSGRVFAVTWKGRRAPNLRQLLGDWFPRYAQEARRRPNRHHLVSIRSDGFIAGSVRFQRGFQGSAIATALVPAGVSLEELQ